MLIGFSEFLAKFIVHNFQQHIHVLASRKIFLAVGVLTKLQECVYCTILHLCCTDVVLVS